jgi:hypothetical protein
MKEHRKIQPEWPVELGPDKLQQWLLAILRFAVTRDVMDRNVALGLAQEMDEPAGRRESDTFQFFRRTSTQFCDSISSPGDQSRYKALRRYFYWIDDRRLRFALEVAARYDASNKQ